MCIINKLNSTLKINQIRAVYKIFTKKFPKICKHEYINMLYKPKIKALKSRFSINKVLVYLYF